MKIAPVSGDLIVKAALVGITALVLGYYVKKATTSLGNSITDAKNSAAATVDAAIHPFAGFDNWVQKHWDSLTGSGQIEPYSLPNVFGMKDPGAGWDNPGQGTTATRPIISWLPDWGINSTPITDAEAQATRNAYATTDPRRLDK